MMLRVVPFLALLASPCIAAAAAELRAPTAAWTVNFDDAQCLASRDYGTPDNRVQLVLKSPAIGDVVQVAIIRDAPRTEPRQLKGRVAVDGGPPVEVSMLTQSPQHARLRVYSMNMPTAQFDLVRRASELSVQTDGLDERFSLGQMTPLLKIVDDCVADLRRVYNVADPATGEASPLPRRAKSNLAYLISNDDHPRDALEREQDGTVKFVLLIDETGRVADCMVAGTSGAAARDAQSCAILDTGAKFEPAIGPDGKPAKDAVAARIVWSTVP